MTTYGTYGGRYVPETLIPALDELTDAWEAALADPSYRAELDELARNYAGRPTPLPGQAPGRTAAPGGIGGRPTPPPAYPTPR